MDRSVFSSMSSDVCPCSFATTSMPCHMSMVSQQATVLVVLFHTLWIGSNCGSQKTDTHGTVVCMLRQADDGMEWCYEVQSW